MAMELSEMWLYPIKSCAGLALERAQVDAMGLRGDRRWMLVDADGGFQSQRTLPTMAQIVPELHGDGLVVRHGARELLLPRPREGAERAEVVVWRDRVLAQRAGERADRWFSDILERELRLVYLPDDSVRAVDPDYARPGDRVSFADGFPILLTSEASLEALNARLEQALPMRRFRPNLVVRGGEAFAEDHWAAMTLGEVPCEGVKRCSRCTITTIDQERGVATGPEPLKTLAAFRRDGASGKVYFGLNVIPRAEGVLEVGVPVRVDDA